MKIVDAPGWIWRLPHFIPHKNKSQAIQQTPAPRKYMFLPQVRSNIPSIVSYAVIHARRSSQVVLESDRTTGG